MSHFTTLSKGFSGIGEASNRKIGFQLTSMKDEELTIPKVRHLVAEDAKILTLIQPTISSVRWASNHGNSVEYTEIFAEAAIESSAKWHLDQRICSLSVSFPINFLGLTMFSIKNSFYNFGITRFENGSIALGYSVNRKKTANSKNYSARGNIAIEFEQPINQNGIPNFTRDVVDFLEIMSGCAIQDINVKIGDWTGEKFPVIISGLELESPTCSRNNLPIVRAQPNDASVYMDLLKNWLEMADKFRRCYRTLSSLIRDDQSYGYLRVSAVAAAFDNLTSDWKIDEKSRISNDKFRKYMIAHAQKLTGNNEFIERVSGLLSSINSLSFKKRLRTGIEHISIIENKVKNFGKIHRYIKDIVRIRNNSVHGRWSEKEEIGNFLASEYAFELITLLILIRELKVDDFDHVSISIGHPFCNFCFLDVRE